MEHKQTTITREVLDGLTGGTEYDVTMIGSGLRRRQVWSGEERAYWLANVAAVLLPPFPAYVEEVKDPPEPPEGTYLAIGMKTGKPEILKRAGHAGWAAIGSGTWARWGITQKHFHSFRPLDLAALAKGEPTVSLETLGKLQAATVRAVTAETDRDMWREQAETARQERAAAICEAAEIRSNMKTTEASVGFARKTVAIQAKTTTGQAAEIETLKAKLAAAREPVTLWLTMDQDTRLANVHAAHPGVADNGEWPEGIAQIFDEESARPIRFTVPAPRADTHAAGRLEARAVTAERAVRELVAGIDACSERGKGEAITFLKLAKLADQHRQEA